MPKIRLETRIERHQSFIDAAGRGATLRAFRDLTVEDVCAEPGVSNPLHGALDPGAFRWRNVRLAIHVLRFGSETR